MARHSTVGVNYNGGRVIAGAATAQLGLAEGVRTALVRIVR